MNIGERKGNTFTVEPLEEPIPKKIEAPVEPTKIEEPELVPVRKE